MRGDSGRHPTATPATATTVRTPSVAIIGAGMSGICMAITLRRLGITDVRIYEKTSELGGTWRDNTYPGLTCDIPSRFYQFTFDTNPDWSRVFSPGAEIQNYFEQVVDKHDLAPIIRFGIEITEAHYDEPHWRFHTSDGVDHEVDFLISATGVLRVPRYPDIPGLSEFDGPVMHSARWDRRVAVEGRRIAVIGTGSTGVQIVCGLAESAQRIDLFQRSAQWILPLPNPRYSALTRRVHRRFPVLDQLAYRAFLRVFEFLAIALVRPGFRRHLISALCRLNLRTVRDPNLRRGLTPDYEPMCRRLVISAGFYPAMKREHVNLIEDGIDHIEQRGIVTADGALHEVDVIVLATGFDAHAYMRPMTLTGLDGLSVDDLWRAGPWSHLTVSLPGFPNFFMLMGPNSPVGNYPLTAIAETQAEHIARWILKWSSGAIDSVAPSEHAAKAYNADIVAAMPGTVWLTGCTSWYFGSSGLPELWPWTPATHRARLLAEPDLDDYVINTTTKPHDNPGNTPTQAQEGRRSVEE